MTLVPSSMALHSATTVLSTRSPQEKSETHILDRVNCGYSFLLRPIRIATFAFTWQDTRPNLTADGTWMVKAVLMVVGDLVVHISVWDRSIVPPQQMRAAATESVSRIKASIAALRAEDTEEMTVLQVALEKAQRQAAAARGPSKPQRILSNGPRSGCFNTTLSSTRLRRPCRKRNR